MRYVLIISCLVGLNLVAQTGWTPVTNFGTNPGNLNMYSYAPAALPANAPLVVVMHGCTQTATQYATESGWNVLANQHQFYTVYPEQIAANNSSTCFNWFNYGDQNRGQGEALSIKQMIDYMKTQYSIDANRIYVTGLSAGACMTNIMLAAYPDVLTKGAVLAGAPYKSASSAFTASSAMNGFVTHTPIVWGDSVRNQNPTYTGTYPKVAIFHGNIDAVVNINNVTEEVKQWTNVHNTDQTADLTQTSFNGNSLVTKNSYYNSSNQTVVETYIINGMGHAIAVDPGTCYQQGGTTGSYATDVNFHSSFWAANFFNILQAPTVITGSTNVSASASGVMYSVLAQASYSYTWTVPTGASIVSGQGTNSIVVNFGSNSGNVSLTETSSTSCKIGPLNLFVNVGTVTSLDAYISKNNTHVFFNREDQSLNIINQDLKSIKNVKLYSMDGQLIKLWTMIETKAYLEHTISEGIYIVEYEIEHVLFRKKILLN